MQKRHHIAEWLAREKNAPVPQVALVFTLCSPLDVFPLVGAATEAAFQENIKALHLSLSPEEKAWLDLERETF